MLECSVLVYCEFRLKALFKLSFISMVIAGGENGALIRASGLWGLRILRFMASMNYDPEL